MKTIIAGSRDITDLKQVFYAVRDSGFDISEVVSGGARGVDRLGEKYAKMKKYLPKPKIFPAHWNKYGKSAGYRRNIEMADYANALIAIWDGKSNGTKHMIEIARRKKLKIFIRII
jgi:hypothetical protein